MVWAPGEVGPVGFTAEPTDTVLAGDVAGAVT